MEQQLQNIDQLFKQRGLTARQQPKHDLFDSISHQLDNRVEKKYNLIKLTWISVAASFITIITSVIILYNQPEQQPIDFAELDILKNSQSFTQLYSAYDISDHTAWLTEYKKGH